VVKLDHSEELTWGVIEGSLENIEQVKGGFTAARRGIVTLPSGKKVFVKIGVDDLTKQWANKEIVTYRFLLQHRYPYLPHLLAHNSDETGFAVDALLSADGWDWSNTWSTDRLDRTLEAMDMLADIKPNGVDKMYFRSQSYSEEDNGWQFLADSEERQRLLADKFMTHGDNDLASNLNLPAMLTQSYKFRFNKSTFVHNDVRADNCAWNKGIKNVQLVDWSWAELGDRRVDINAMLVNAEVSGLDVSRGYRSRLDAPALQWLAGYWFKQAITPVWSGGPKNIREFQLLSGITAIKMANKL
jgi:hypothetical protein